MSPVGSPAPGSSEVDFLAVASQWGDALVVPALAVFGAPIALLQWCNARRQTDISAANLRLAMLDRRMNVFEATREFLASILRTGSVDYPEINAYWQKVYHAEFIFDRAIYDYLDRIRLDANDLAHEQRREGLQGVDLRQSNDRQHELIVSLTITRLDGLSETFRPYMSVSR